jgi:amino acid permease
MFTKKAIGSNQQAISMKNLVKATMLIIVYFFFSFSVNAQCAMCRAALEGEGNIKKAEAVNDGIVYLMMIPYIMVGVVGFFVYRMFRKKKATV